MMSHESRYRSVCQSSFAFSFASAPSLLTLGVGEWGGGGGWGGEGSWSGWEGGGGGFDFEIECSSRQCVWNQRHTGTLYQTSQNQNGNHLPV